VQTVAGVVLEVAQVDERRLGGVVEREVEVAHLCSQHGLCCR
jgi:hypothetical protein